MMAWLILFLFVAAVFFLTGKYWDSDIRPVLFSRKVSRKPPTGEFFIGLSRLMDEEGDESIDTFIKSLEDHAEQLDARIALSILLRRRGKVDQSVAICQRILSASVLTIEEVSQVKMELARSYIAAGLLDRVEKLLKDLTSSSSSMKEQALELSITLFQIERDWEQAINSALDLKRIRKQPKSDGKQDEIDLMLSHFYCELAEQSPANKALEYLDAGSRFMADNPRVTELRVLHDAGEGQTDAAAKGMLDLIQNSPERAAEVFRLITGDHPGICKSIAEALLASMPDPRDTDVEHSLLYAFLLEEYRSVHAAMEYLTVAMQDGCDISQFLHLAGLVAIKPDDHVMAKMLELRRSMTVEDIQYAPRYYCTACGFEARLHHWQCPGCSKWSTFLPVTQRYMNSQVII